ncbi:hypothetical protein JQ557_33425 [Bradyrhizobium sp. U87765 SZCCT0131]|uniref:hypothetical protein n=1 Tax=unclassified Bradyrhizobium TaxID=2631580 RepID=UPI001BA4E03F|nr:MULTISPECIES: hypothetical protein [unclassified Bradyrhizobium]MBR1222944.1 hypothetical protein [Bradyrhizobium sp. U87765 SZCCT0131]MBR1262680.1 hypothetical protein [Bradyrhizobium sp. U87765 SZCCT0134]MBR1308848.1 hypothetical protein [Bradyrhizobium sp. U87765 SZCCT0110]MBR1318462.1 hypothetical protein [Bradyrhizobium sp. U87765 SZCCT0109]MBR1352166.1 hypothetical protein [Bradyrhizobium sp. U87765 SZCCT0048]
MIPKCHHCRRAGRPFAAALSLLLVVGLLAAPHGASAQMFSDRPPPIPPRAVPESPAGPAMNLAPPSGAAAGPAALPSPITQPPVAAAPLAPPPAAAAVATPGQPVLALSARFGKELATVNSGLVWRVYADKPDAAGAFKLVREERSPTPNIVLPPGSYVVHVGLGLVSAVRPVTIRQDTTRETFDLPAGGLRIEGKVGSSKIPPNQIAFSIYKGSQFEVGDRAPLAQNVAAGEVLLVPEGTYYIISNYGDANSVVRSDIRIQAGKLTDVTVTHRAAVITLKLVGEKGGEALANTSWSVITPGGDVVKESIGAFPRVILAEGEYRAIAKNEGKVFERSFNVVNGVDGEVEVVAR